MRPTNFPRLIAWILLVLCYTKAMTEAKQQYSIRTKANTSLSTFKDFVQDLDQGKGKQETPQYVRHQIYVTSLSDSQAEEVRKKDFVLFVEPISDTTPLNYTRAAPKLRRAFPKSNVHLPTFNESYPAKTKRDESVPNQLQLLSWNRMGKPPPETRYRQDKRKGKGVTVYILDTGFNLRLRELAPKDRTVKHYFPPDYLTPVSGHGLRRRRVNIDDRDNHGSTMAVVTGGVTIGIASKANLYLIKIGHDYKDEDGNNEILTTPATWQNVLDHVIFDLGRRADNPEPGDDLKSVVTLSSVLDHDDDHDHVYTAMVQEFYDDLATYDVVAVCSAGNDAPYGRTLKDYYFSALSTDDNVGMPVGGINMDGTLYDFTPPDAGGAKKVVYAQATDLDLMLADGTMEWGADGGVSTPTQIVGATIAMFLGVDQCDTDPAFHGLDRKLYDSEGNPMAIKIKDFIKHEASFQRSERILARGSQYREYARPPRRVNAIYNLARGPAPN